jgi:DNA-directed RNA polymerase subunit RPC12/RpoP
LEIGNKKGGLMAVSYGCDRCGRLVHPEVDLYELNIREPMKDRPVIRPIEICAHCKEEIVAFINNQKEV